MSFTRTLPWIYPTHNRRRSWMNLNERFMNPTLVGFTTFCTAIRCFKLCCLNMKKRQYCNCNQDFTVCGRWTLADLWGSFSKFFFIWIYVSGTTHTHKHTHTHAHNQKSKKSVRLVPNCCVCLIVDYFFIFFLFLHSFATALTNSDKQQPVESESVVISEEIIDNDEENS